VPAALLKQPAAHRPRLLPVLGRLPRAQSRMAAPSSASVSPSDLSLRQLYQQRQNSQPCGRHLHDGGPKAILEGVLYMSMA
jgi:hypothetical protein